MGIKAKYSEEDLIALLRQRKEIAFEYLYENYSGALYGVIFPIVKSEELSGDILQEVFVKIWRQITTYESEKGRLFTWMLNIARNASIDYVRSRDFKDSQKNHELSDFVYNLQSGEPAAEEHIGLQGLVAQLKEEYSILIDLAYFKGYTQEEISSELNLPLGTVKTCLRKALLDLRRLMIYLIILLLWT